MQNTQETQEISTLFESLETLNVNLQEYTVNLKNGNGFDSESGLNRIADIHKRICAINKEIGVFNNLVKDNKDMSFTVEESRVKYYELISKYYVYLNTGNF